MRRGRWGDGESSIVFVNERGIIAGRRADAASWKRTPSRPSSTRPPSGPVSTLPIPLGNPRSSILGDPTARRVPENRSGASWGPSSRPGLRFQSPAKSGTPPTRPSADASAGTNPCADKPPRPAFGPRALRARLDGGDAGAAISHERTGDGVRRASPPPANSAGAWVSGGSKGRSPSPGPAGDARSVAPKGRLALPP